MFWRLYNPADYEHLAVSPEVKELFQYISRSVSSVDSLHVLPMMTAFISNVHILCGVQCYSLGVAVRNGWMENSSSDVTVTINTTKQPLYLPKTSDVSATTDAFF